MGRYYLRNMERIKYDKYWEGLIFSVRESTTQVLGRSSRWSSSIAWPVVAL